MTDEPIKKYELKISRDLDLSMYIYVVRTGGVMVNVPQAVEVIVAYTEDEAVATLTKKYPIEAKLVYDPKGKVPVSNFLNLIENRQQEGTPLAKSKADYYLELMEDLRKIAKDHDLSSKDFNKVLDLLEGIVKESRLFQQLQ